MNKKKKGYAFFDLDFTLIPHDTLLLFCNYVLRRNRSRLFYALIFAPFLPFAALKLIGSEKLKRIFLCFLWRMPGSELEAAAESFVREEVLPEIYPELKIVLDEFRKKNVYTILNTASPEFYAKHIADALGFDACCATLMRVDEVMPLFPTFNAPNNKRYQKLFTMAPFLPPETRAFIESASATEIRPPVVPDSHAFSDSPADLPLLRLAAKGTLVHPLSSRLIQEGEASGWNVVRPPRPYKGFPGRLWAQLRQALGLYRRSR